MMKKLLLGTMLLALAMVVPASTMAQVGVSVGIALPPPVVFQAAPEVVVLPETDDVYVVPDVDVDIFFWSGWWWRPWEGRWYRSRYYDRGWGYYRHVPWFYFDVDPGWRGYYRDRHWRGHPWRYERIHYRHMHDNWRKWHNSRHWRGKRAWNVENYKPRPNKERNHLRNQRRVEYNKRPEVQKHQQLIQEQKKRPRVYKPKGEQQRQPRAQKPRAQQQKQPRAQKPRTQQQRQPRAQKPARQQQRPPQHRQMRQQQRSPQTQKSMGHQHGGGQQ